MTGEPRTVGENRNGSREEGNNRNRGQLLLDKNGSVSYNHTISTSLAWKLVLVPMMMEMCRKTISENVQYTDKPPGFYGEC